MRYYEAPTILIGGDGADDVEGASGGDCLIGGSTTFDANLTVLRSLLAEWVRTDVAYADKVAHLTGPAPGGLNAPYFLNASAVIDVTAAINWKAHLEDRTSISRGCQGRSATWFEVSAPAKSWSPPSDVRTPGDTR